MKALKLISEMNAAELYKTMLDDSSPRRRMSALYEIERRKAAQANKVRRAIETMIDSIGLTEALTLIAEICEERKDKAEEAEALKWAVREDAVRQAAGESE